MDRRHGNGTYGYADGSVYVGQFNAGKVHGKGTLTKANGEKQEGTFMYGQFKN